MLRWIHVFTVYISLVPTLSFAQQVTGKLEGRIVDEHGKPVPAVNILVSSPSLQGIRGTTSADNGYFRCLALPVGLYKLKLSHIAYQEVTYYEITVSLGRTFTLGEIQLESRSIEMSEVVVSGRRPAIDPASTTVGATLSSADYSRLPIERNFRSIATLAPQANQSYYGDAVNISGSTGLENMYFIDGINVTDPYEGRTSTNLPYNFVKEIEVKTGGYEAEFGRALGGIVNVITHTGGNDFHGSVFGFLTGDRLQNESRLGLTESAINDFSQGDVGVSLNGPVLRDRLWFSLAYNYNFENKDVEIPGLGFHQDEKTSHILAGKLTWLARKNTNFIFSLLADPSIHHQVGDGTPGGIPAPTRLGNIEPFLGRFERGGTSVSAKVHHAFSDDIFLEASIARSQHKEINEAGSERGRTEPLFVDLVTGAWSGGYSFFWNPRSTRNAAQIKTTFLTSQHTIKLGIEIEDNQLDENFRLPFLIFKNSDNAYRSQVFIMDFDGSHRVPTFFAQDSWQIGDRFRVNYGLRWDGSYWIKDGETALSITDQWQPRIGLTFQPARLGAQKIFGSFGRYYEQLGSFAIRTQVADWKLLLIDYDQNPLTTTVKGDTIDLSRTGAEPAITDLEGQHHDEFVLGYERNVGDRFKVGVKGIYRTLRQSIEDAFLLSKGSFVLGNLGKGELDFLPRAKREYRALEFTLSNVGSGPFAFQTSYVLSRNYGNYPGVFDSDLGRECANCNTALSLEEQVPNSTGLLPNNRTHVFKFSGSYTFPFGLDVGTFILWQSGTPLSEFGGTSIGPAWYSFLSQRGTAGQTPAVFDANFRVTYDLANLFKSRHQSKLILDVFHVPNRRSAVSFDQIRYGALDAEGNQTGLNPSYMEPIRYQPPMTVRLGVEFGF